MTAQPFTKHPLLMKRSKTAPITGLRASAETMAALLTKSTRRLTASGMAIGQPSLASFDREAVFEAVKPGSLAAIFAMKAFDARMVVIMDRSIVFALTEALLGSDGAEPHFEAERAFSKIEQRIARPMLNHVGMALENALSPALPGAIIFEKIETVHGIRRHWQPAPNGRRHDDRGVADGSNRSACDRHSRDGSLKDRARIGPRLRKSARMCTIRSGRKGSARKYAVLKSE